MNDAVYLVVYPNAPVGPYYTTRHLRSGHGRRVTYAGTRRWVEAEIGRGRQPDLPWRNG